MWDGSPMHVDGEGIFDGAVKGKGFRKGKTPNLQPARRHSSLRMTRPGVICRQREDFF